MTRPTLPGSDEDPPGGTDDPTADAPGVDGSPRRRRWPWVVGALLTLLLVGIFTVPTGWDLYSPGSLRPTEAAISIKGHTAFESRGAITYPTVSIGTRPTTVAGLIRGLLDDRIDIKSKQDIYPAGNIQQDEVVNQQMMEDSKLAATVVAFRKVGYPVSVTGTGAFIDQVLKGFPASSTLHQGDVITAVGGHPITTADQLRPLLAGHASGSTVDLTIRRPAQSSANQSSTTLSTGASSSNQSSSRTFDASVALGSNPQDPSRGYLGVAVSTADQGLDLPFGIDMDSGAVTGPSGGLAWTLGLIDRLTPGDLTGGKTVVATGEMAVDGTVGQIGGLEQKMAAVLRNGADIFLYPASSPKASVRTIQDMAKGHDVKLYPVSNIDDALKILAPKGLQPAPPLN
jgi:PDZ domain-containing protein